MGALVSNHDDGTWYMATEIDPSATTELTVPVLAGGSFEIGTCTYTVADGKAVATFTFDVPEESMTITAAYTGALRKLEEELPAGTLSKAVLENNTLTIDLPAADGAVYVIARLDCVLDIDYVMETYQAHPSQMAIFQAHQ